jgi:membrane associated rhomboid family serine protease
VPATVSRVSVGAPGAIYAVGTAIYLLRRQQPQLVWRAANAPVGLSISNKRIVWGENVKGHGRIKAVTVR